MLATYKNGDFEVTIFESGTKERIELKTNGVPIFPETIDVKITDYCDLNCPFCHEGSTIKGVHADLDQLLKILSALPPGIELAIGGGNPISHPDIASFLCALRQMGFIPNLTLNQRHIKPFFPLIEKLIQTKTIYGLGVSLANSVTNFDSILKLSEMSSNLVFHVISGINSPKIISDVAGIVPGSKFLILGYKDFGRGVNFRTEFTAVNLKNWYRELDRILRMGIVISFDNLALEQLRVKRLLTADAWDRNYMGDDFEFSMYIDAVKKTFAPTSRSENRSCWDEIGLLDFFQNK